MLTTMSTLFKVSVRTNGCLTIVFNVSRSKYSSRALSLIVMLPAPVVKRTRATEHFLLPVPKNSWAFALTALVVFLVAGLLTVLIRKFGSLPEGVSYSILLMNIATPLIDNITINKKYGFTKKVKEDK